MISFTRCVAALPQCGGFLYSYVKFKEKQNEQVQQPVLPTHKA